MNRTITLKPLSATISESAKKLVLLLLPILCIASVAFAQAPLISMQNGSIVYNKYANQGETALVNQIPDFSGVGYRGGGITLPTLSVKKTVTAIQGDCRTLIQAAIDEVSALPLDANGFRGAILLKAGVYPVDSSLFIRTSGVVLRGEGNGINGTVLIATKTAQHTLIVIQGTTTGGEIAGTRVRVSPTYVPVGAKTFSVVTNNFQAGDEVVVRKTPTQNWIDRMDMAQYGWTISGYTRSFYRKVVSVSGNSITLDMPMVDPIDEAYGGADVYKTNLVRTVKECGIENMRIESVFSSSDDENHGWYAIKTDRVENSWVKGVVAKYFGNGAVNISTSSRFITVEDCVMADPKSITTGGRKYSFNIESGATAILFQRCMSWGGRHDFVTGGTVPGPNVFLDCVVQASTSDSGPHHRYSTGQLYDNLYGQMLRVQNRGASGTGHGWSGAQILFYNCESTQYDIRVSSPPGARNWGIGCKGLAKTGDGYWESWGTNVLPRSLYLQQLQERLGSAAVNNIATSQQLTNPVSMRNAMVTRVNAIKNESRVGIPTITYYKIKVASSPTFVLHSTSANPVNGTNVDLYSGNFGATQEWQLIDTDNGFKRIVSKTNANMVLEYAGIPANNINVRLGTWTGSTRQQWLVTNVGGGTYKITARENTAQGLDCAATPANNVNVRLWSYAGGPKQKWIIESVADGSLFFNKGAYLKLQQTTPSDLSLNYSIDGVVNYTLPSADQTDLTLYNLNGQKVTNLFNGFSASGEHRLNMNALGISTGIYIIRLTSGSKIKTLKIMINQ